MFPECSCALSSVLSAFNALTHVMLTSTLHGDQYRNAYFLVEETETEKLSHFLKVSQSARDEQNWNPGSFGEVRTLCS